MDSRTSLFIKSFYPYDTLTTLTRRYHLKIKPKSLHYHTKKLGLTKLPRWSETEKYILLNSTSYAQAKLLIPNRSISAMRTMFHRLTKESNASC
jgi:hypothetical protein